MNDGIMVSFHSTIKRVNTVCATLSGMILLFVTFSIFIDVILRYFFNRPSIWITEVSTYLFLYIIFFATAYTLQQEGHIRVTFLLNPLPDKVKRIVNLITSLMATIFTAILLWQSWIMTWTAFKEKWSSPTMLNAPYAYIHVAMVIGSFFLLLTFISIMVIQFQTTPSDDPEEKA